MSHGYKRELFILLSPPPLERRDQREEGCIEPLRESVAWLSTATQTKKHFNSLFLTFSSQVAKERNTTGNDSGLKKNTERERSGWLLSVEVTAFFLNFIISRSSSQSVGRSVGRLMSLSARRERGINAASLKRREGQSAYIWLRINVSRRSNGFSFTHYFSSHFYSILVCCCLIYCLFQESGL